jgi:hypothetical protein
LRLNPALKKQRAATGILADHRVGFLFGRVVAPVCGDSFLDFVRGYAADD